MAALHALDRGQRDQCSICHQIFSLVTEKQSVITLLEILELSTLMDLI